MTPPYHLIKWKGVHQNRVNSSMSETCLVAFDNNKYSVSANAVSRPAEDATRTPNCNSGRDDEDSSAGHV
jgi:hypothetical protein